MRTIRRPLALLVALAATTMAASVFAQSEAPETGTTDEVAPSDATEPTDAQPGEPGGSGETTQPEAPPPPVEPPPPAVETECADGVDNDGDGLVDCSDSDCAEDPSCKPPEPIVVEPMAIPEPQLDSKVSEGPPPETTLGLEALIGITGRIGSISSGYESSERAGLQYGLGVFFAPDRQYALGLSYLYSGLGTEKFNPSYRDANGRIDRRLHNIAAHLRGYPLRSDSLGLWAGVNLGATLQTATARGSTYTDTLAIPATAYKTDIGPKAGFALGGAVGMDWDIDNNLAMLASLSFTHHRLSSDPIQGDAGTPAIPGIGALSQLDFRLAFQYRFDVANMDAPVSATVETGSR